MSLNVSSRYGFGVNIRKNLSFQQNPLQNTGLPILQQDTFQKAAFSLNKPVIKTAKTMNVSEAHNKSKIHVISFAGNHAKNQNQVALVGAEFPPYFKVGGVATVMGDYPGMFKAKGKESKVFIPYYNGAIEYDKQTGDPTGKVGVLKKDGKPIITNVDMTAIKVEDLKPGEYHELEEVAKKTMKWGGTEEEVVLYKKAGTEHYFVYTDATARMPKPYANGEYYSSERKPSIDGTHGDPYAKFGKAYTELVPELEKEGFNPARHLLSDAQTAFIPEFMAQKIVSKDPYYQGAKSSYVMHNVGGGYQGETSAQNMFYDFATKEQIQTVDKDPEFLKARLEGTTEQYYKQFIPSLIDEKGAVNASMIPIRYAQQGYVPYINTVSEGYAEDAIKNPETAKGLTGHLKELYEQRKFDGILNGFGDTSFDPAKPLGFKVYDEVCTDEKLGVTHQPFKRFSADMPYEEIRKAKLHNAKSLLGRLVEGADPKYALDVLIGKHKESIGYIDPKFINNDVKVAVSWGRGDKQKGLDIAIRGFVKYITGKGKDKNIVLVVGGVLDDANPESAIIKKEMQASLTNPETKGKIVFIDGFAPAKALSSAGSAGVFPSRFAPCELIELEAMKYGCTPIVTNMQGMAQKNPDPRIPEEADKATSFKTKDPFHSVHERLINASSQFKQGYQELIEAEKKKLAIRGVVEDKLDKVAQKRVMSESNPKYADLFRKCADDLLVDDIVEALDAKFNATPELDERLVKNALNAKTDWDNNHALHPDGKSSADKYVENHLNRESKPPTKRLFEFPQAIYDRVKAAEEAAKKASEKATTVVKEVIKETSHNGKYFTLGALAAGVAGIALYAFGGKKDNTNQTQDEPVQAQPIKNQVSANNTSNSNQVNTGTDLKTRLAFFNQQPVQLSK